MNTSAKGASYENRYKRKLLADGARLVYRSAASQGPFDLIAWIPGTIQPLGYQLKDSVDHFRCRSADRLLNILAVDWPEFIPYVVHRTKEKEFCEH